MSEKMLKKAQVVCLPTEKCEVGQLAKGKNSGWRTVKSYGIAQMLSRETRDGTVLPMHMYFTTTDSIRPGQLFINKDGVWEHNGGVEPERSARRVVASSDPKDWAYNGVHKISPDFITTFCKQSGLIEEVNLVCYDHDDYSTAPVGASYGSIKPRGDGTVIVHKLPSNEITKAAVKKAALEAFVHPETFMTGITFDEDKFEDWYNDTFN